MERKKLYKRSHWTMSLNISSTGSGDIWTQGECPLLVCGLSQRSGLLLEVMLVHVKHNISKRVLVQRGRV